MPTLDDVLGYLQTAGGGVTGIKSAPDYPPEQAGDFPFFVTYPGAFQGHQGPQGSMTMLYDMVCELHIARQNALPTEVEALLGYPESIAEALFEACNTYALAQNGIEGSFGALGWGDTKTIGFTWVVKEVKIITNFT